MIKLKEQYYMLTEKQVHKIIILIALLVPAFFIISCNNGETNSREQLIPVVEALPAQYGSLPLSERLTGVVKAKNQVEIYPQISAPVTAVFVNNGDFVRAGQPLVKFRDKEFQDRLKQAKANHQIALAQARQAEARFREAENALQRTKSLAEQGLASSSELENVLTQKISAEANLDLARARIAQAEASMEESEEELSETLVRAAVSGTVGNRNAEIGMLVNSSSRLFTLGDLKDLKVEIVLTDRMLNYIKVGQRSEVLSESFESGVLQAPVSRISPFLHPVTHSTEAEIDLKNPDGILKPGMFVTVDVFYGESEQATLIPLSALYENPATGETGVFVSKRKITKEPVSRNTADKSIALTAPVSFSFSTIDIIARGRMQAGVKGIAPDEWVVTLGQNLLGSDSAMARVHPVNWNWVEGLQKLQSEDLLKDIMELQQQVINDSLNSNIH